MKILAQVLSRVLAVAGLVLWTCRQVVLSSTRVIRDVIVPSDRIVPGVVVLPLRSRSDLEVAVLAGLITLTPGTLTVAVRREPRSLWVHGMYVDDATTFRAELSALEARVLRALRRATPGEEIGP